MPEKFVYLPFDLVERKNWGARDPGEEGIGLMTPVAYVIHTYTDTEPCFDRSQCISRMRSLQARDLSLGLSDIRYNFVIGGDGGVYVGRGWTNLPDIHEDYPQLFEKSIEIAHIGFEGEPEEEAMHAVKLLLKFGVARKHLASNFKYVQHFKELIKDEEHYEMGASGELEMTCYKKLGEPVERDESDEYKVLSNTSPRIYEYFLEKDDDDSLPPELDQDDCVEVSKGVQVDKSLLDPQDLEEITKETPKSPMLDSKDDPTYIS